MPKMTEEKRNRKLVFITGLSLGLVLGGAIIFFSQNTQIIKYPIEVSQNTIESIVERVSGTMSAKQDSIDKANKKINYKKFEKNNINQSKNDSLFTSNQRDSLSNSIDTLNSSSEIIEVKKDQLMAQKNIEALNFDAVDNKSNKDSLLQAASGIQIEKKNLKKVIVNTEFWKSPINYRGYKFVKNKLILFGIDAQDENLAMIIYDGSYFLKTINGVLRINFSEDFKSFDRINNPTISAMFE